ncbi:dynein regulatory complex protein 11 [Condylostylus longicornis]|uniref:dynein regulatory complex protein 11 n=1 Tax=Condylostylus longicornis TaxID=2530218 RepID=UPI00244DA70C|nr:dynein regulatory complex protein 11 [Condylostylus longicornis]
MSNQFYNNIWHESQKDLEILASFDSENQTVDPFADKSQAQTTTFELYVRYIRITNNLEEAYDKMVQPQKRLLIRKLLDACLGRIIEIKHDLVNLDMMEFSYNDKVMEKLKLTPMDVELRVPRYFKREREKEIQERKKTMNEILNKLGWLDDSSAKERLNELQAIKIIQVHERARQGRLRAHFMKEIRILKEKGKSELRNQAESGLIAAMKIQKAWRGYAARKKTRRRKMEEMILIGMIPPASKKKSEAIEKMNDIIAERYKTQEEYREKFEVALKNVKEEIKNKQGAVLMEDMADDIRAWIKDSYEKTGKFPDFPSEDSGGSRHIFSSRQGTESEMSRSSAKSSSKESRKTKDKSKSPARSGDLNIAEDNLEEGFHPTPSVFLPDLKTGAEEFVEVWKNKDESENTKQTHYDDMIYTEKYNEVERELRKIVDDLMRQELEQLQAALDRDRAARGKKAKKSTKKARRSGKKSKKKKEKDLTPDRTTESLFEELVTNGIIKKYPETPLSSYLGDKAYAERSGTNPTPGDIRQLLIEYCILPLGSDTIRNYCPTIRSILLTGSKGVGKKALLHAICTEVGAVLFDITPANIVGKYPGKSGLIMLLHLISKVSRLLQPSVIFMGDAERPFMKKVPKTDRTDPKRLKKDLPKIIRNINVEDRVIFIGTSNLPWEADQKLLQQTYNRFIYLPRPDYGALSFAWKELTKEYVTPGLGSFDYSVMGKISDGFTIGAIAACLDEVMTCKRKLQLRSQPLTHVELINALSTKEPVYREEEEAFESWWSKTPLGRRKIRAIEMEETAKLEEAEAAAKAGKKSPIKK